MDHFQTPEQKHLAWLFDEFVASYKGDYDECFTQEVSYLDELVHWLFFHRWWTIKELRRVFPGAPHERITQKLTYKCHPTMDD